MEDLPQHRPLPRAPAPQQGDLVFTDTTDRFRHERVLLASGRTPVAGVDEAGRGPLAGPVVAAAVLLPMEWVQVGMPEELRALNDSKQLSEVQRDCFFHQLTTHSRVHFAIARVEADVIDAINILQATHRAMNDALRLLNPKPVHALVDGTLVKGLTVPQTPLVKGDSLSYSIAAASVLAKVTRDRIMREADACWSGYGFARHKGYPTAEHLAALATLGPCPIHRRSFAPLRQPERRLFD